MVLLMSFYVSNKMTSEKPYSFTQFRVSLAEVINDAPGLYNKKGLFLTDFTCPSWLAVSLCPLHTRMMEQLLSGTYQRVRFMLSLIGSHWVFLSRRMTQWSLSLKWSLRARMEGTRIEEEEAGGREPITRHVPSIMDLICTNSIYWKLFPARWSH